MLERYLIVIGQILSSGELAFRAKEIMCLGASDIEFEHSLCGIVFCHVKHQDTTHPCSEKSIFV